MNEPKVRAHDDDGIPEIPKGRRPLPMPMVADDAEDLEVNYVRKTSGSIFRVAREDLPRWFIDHRVEVRMTPSMGKGCFALEDIEKNTLIESAPVILVHNDTFRNLNEFNGGVHKLSEYPFSWGRDGLCAIALGYGGIYNHKPSPNVVWRPSYEHESLQYTTSKDIRAGEEIFIRYLPLDRLDHLWFEDSDSQLAADVWRRDKSVSMGDIRTWDVYKKGLP